MNRRELLAAAIGSLPVATLAKLPAIESGLQPITLKCNPLTVKCLFPQIYATSEMFSDDSVMAAILTGQAEQQNPKQFDTRSKCETCDGEGRIDDDCGCGGDCWDCMEGDTRCPDCDGTGHKVIEVHQWQS